MEAKYTKLLHEKGTGVDRFLQILDIRLPTGTYADSSANQRASPSVIENAEAGRALMVLYYN
jgi:ribosome biogenesis GTPase A